MSRPPFCPNRSCPAHWSPPEGRWWVRRGSYSTLLHEAIPRYRCRLCGRGFSRQTFSIDYYAKRLLDYRRLVALQVSCAGLRQSSRALGVSCGTIENKTMRLARQAISAQARALEGASAEEDLCADGLQSYWVSQYVPNNLTVLVGAESRFLYAWNAASLRRSGRMTEAQQRRRAALEHRWRADPASLKDCFAELCDTLCSLIGASRRALTLFSTDEHSAYRAVLAAHRGWLALRGSGRARHRTVSSRALRVASNPLAAVNTVDRQIRIDLAEHVRETVRFARNPNRSMERFAVWAWAYNYTKRWRINQPADDPTTHAEVAGIDAGRIAFSGERLFSRRRFLSHTPLSGRSLALWARMLERPFSSGADYLPRYLLA